jgi:hypothetical protein
MTSNKIASDAAAAAAVVSPLWLPWLHQASELAAMVVPILGAILLVIRIGVLLHAFMGGSWRKFWWIGALLWLALLLAAAAYARDDGRYAQSPLKPWFDRLRSGKGLCCSDADGFAVSDPDWKSKDGHYRVRLDGEWINVPDDAVITEPNRYGRTMVWPIKGPTGTWIRCFMPGSTT